MANFTKRTKQDEGSGWLVQPGNMFVPDAPGNRHYAKIQEDITNGESVLEFEAFPGKTLTQAKSIKKKQLSHTLFLLEAVNVDPYITKLLNPDDGMAVPIAIKNYSTALLNYGSATRTAIDLLPSKLAVYRFAFKFPNV